MSFADFLIKGPSFSNRNYDFKAHSNNHKLTPSSDLRERMSSLWQKFSNYARGMLSAGGVLVGIGITVLTATPLPPVWIAGGVLIAAGIALVIFAGVRYYQAGLQQKMWKSDTFWQQHESLVKSEKELKESQALLEKITEDDKKIRDAIDKKLEQLNKKPNQA
jgi:hypothetical protein